RILEHGHAVLLCRRFHARVQRYQSRCATRPLWTSVLESQYVNFVSIQKPYHFPLTLCFPSRPTYLEYSPIVQRESAFEQHKGCSASAEIYCQRDQLPLRVSHDLAPRVSSRARSASKKSNLIRVVFDGSP